MSFTVNFCLQYSTGWPILRFMSDMKSKFVDDVTGLVAGLGIAAQGAREEIEQAIRARFDALMAENGLVSREEFEVVRDMAVAAREENQALRSEIEALKKAK